MPLDKTTRTQRSVADNIRKLRSEKFPQRQAIAIALSTARRYGKKKADGGEVRGREPASGLDYAYPMEDQMTPGPTSTALGRYWTSLRHGPWSSAKRPWSAELNPAGPPSLDRYLMDRHRQHEKRQKADGGAIGALPPQEEDIYSHPEIAAGMERIADIGRMFPNYQPGTRESVNVEDRRDERVDENSLLRLLAGILPWDAPGRGPSGLPKDDSGLLPGPRTDGGRVRDFSRQLPTDWSSLSDAVTASGVAQEGWPEPSMVGYPMPPMPQDVDLGGDRPSYSSALGLARRYADGGWAGEMGSPAEMTGDLTTRSLFPPLWEDTLGKRSWRDALGVLAQETADNASLPAEMSGIPSVIRGVRDIGEGHKVRGAAEIAAGALPIASVARSTAPLVEPLFRTLPRTLGTLMAPKVATDISEAMAPEAAQAQAGEKYKEPSEKDTKNPVWVRNQQARLHAKGIYAADPDGQWGAGTRDALRQEWELNRKEEAERALKGQESAARAAEAAARAKAAEAEGKASEAQIEEARRKGAAATQLAEDKKKYGERLTKTEENLGPWESALRLAAPYIGMVPGALLGAYFGAKAPKVAEWFERRRIGAADKLLKRPKVAKGDSKDSALNQRIENINRFYQEGSPQPGMVGRLRGEEAPPIPFSPASSPPWWKANKKGVPAATDLYPPPSKLPEYTANAAAASLIGGGEWERANAMKQDAQARLDRALDAWDKGPNDALLREIMDAKYQIDLARLGEGFGIGSGLGQFGKGSHGIFMRPRMRPAVERGGAERANLTQILGEKKAAASAAKAKKAAKSPTDPKGLGKGKSKKSTLHEAGAAPLAPLATSQLLGQDREPIEPFPAEMDTLSATPDFLPEEEMRSHGGEVKGTKTKHHSHFQPRGGDGKWAGGPVWPQPRAYGASVHKPVDYGKALALSKAYADGGQVAEFGNTRAEVRDLERQMRIQRMAQGNAPNEADAAALASYYGRPYEDNPTRRGVNKYIPSLYALPVGLLDFLTFNNAHNVVSAMRPILGDDGIDIAPETPGQVAQLRQNYPISYYAGKFAPAISSSLFSGGVLPLTGAATAYAISTDPNINRVAGDYISRADGGRVRDDAVADYFRDRDAEIAGQVSRDALAGLFSAGAGTAAMLPGGGGRVVRGLGHLFGWGNLGFAGNSLYNAYRGLQNRAQAQRGVEMWGDKPLQRRIEWTPSQEKDAALESYRDPETGEVRYAPKGSEWRHNEGLRRWEMVPPRRASGGGVDTGSRYRYDDPMGVEPWEPIDTDWLKQRQGHLDQLVRDEPLSVGNANALLLGGGIGTALHMLGRSVMPIPIRGLMAVLGGLAAYKGGRGLWDDFGKMSEGTQASAELRELNPLLDKKARGSSPAAYSVDRREMLPPGRADGGVVNAGLIDGPTGGRDDAKSVSVPSGAYIVPSDIVAYAGGGNTSAGAEAFRKALPPPRGETGGNGVAIRISDGEVVISPDQVAAVGGGDIEKGHKILDSLIKQMRRKHIAQLKSLPEPSKS